MVVYRVKKCGYLKCNGVCYKFFLKSLYWIYIELNVMFIFEVRFMFYFY